MGYLFLLFLTLQDDAAFIALGGAIIVFLVVIFLISTSLVKEDKYAAKKKVYKVRSRYFFVLTAVIIAMLLFSLRLLPYPRFQAKPDMTVTVVGRQWAWVLANGVSNQKPQNFSGSNEITIPIHKTIRFIVTSADVNHDFAIYNSDGVLLVQTQAMPDYDNKLEYNFTEPGDYKILCLEYCGVAHPFMAGTIHVK